MKQPQIDYRQWPNILELNEKISILESKLDDAESEVDRLNIRQALYMLISKKYDQIQFNKELARKETK